MKAAAIVISILLVIVLLTGAVSTLSSGFTNFEFRSWLDRFAASDQPVITEDPIVEEPTDEDPIIDDPLEEECFSYIYNFSFLNYSDFSENEELLETSISTFKAVDSFDHWAYILNGCERFEVGSFYNINFTYKGVIFDYICIWDYLGGGLCFGLYNDEFDFYQTYILLEDFSGYSNFVKIKNVNAGDEDFHQLRYNSNYISSYLGIEFCDDDPNGIFTINSIKKV